MTDPRERATSILLTAVPGAIGKENRLAAIDAMLQFRKEALEEAVELCERLDDYNHHPELGHAAAIHRLINKGPQPDERSFGIEQRSSRLARELGEKKQDEKPYCPACSGEGNAHTHTPATKDWRDIPITAGMLVDCLRQEHNDPFTAAQEIVRIAKAKL